MFIVLRKRRCPADNIPCIVDVPSCTQTWFMEASQVDHRAVLPKEGVGYSGRVGTRANDLSNIVDGIREAVVTPQRPQVGHRPILPKKPMPGFPPVAVARSDDLPRLVNIRGDAKVAVAGQGPEIADRNIHERPLCESTRNWRR